MKIFCMIFLATFSLGACAKENKTPVNKTDKPALNKAADKKAEAPCDSKEDILKKLEEKKKAEEAAGKAFSLQGGNTGCSVK